MKEEWKFVLTPSGAQFVMISGLKKTPWLFVDNLDNI